METATIKMMNQDFVRLDRFDGVNFTRWKDKMKFMLTALKIFYVLDPNLPSFPPPLDDDSDELKEQRKKREEDEVMCRGHILNALSDRLYDLYTIEPSAVEIWKALEFKYKAEDEGNKKFLISKYFEHKFNDNMPILAQVHELQVIVNQLRAAEIELPESFQVGAIIAKLPTSWKGYRKKLLHDSKEFSLEQIQKDLRIEEESRARDKEKSSFDDKNNANAVSKPSNYTKTEKQNKESSLGPKKDKEKFKKPKKGGCFVCGKPGHYARDCRFKKTQKLEANSLEENDEIIATVSEVNFIQGKVSGWWYDTGATVHVCYDKSLFKTYQEIHDGQKVQMGNEGRSKVIGKGNVELAFTSGKVVTLTNVLHVPA